MSAPTSPSSSASAEFGRDATPLTQSLFTIPSYTLLDLRAGVRFDGGRYLVELWGRNVTNKFYVNNIAVAGDSVVRFTGMPATYGLRFSYRM